MESAIVVKNTEARTNRRMIIVTGLISCNAVFVATNDDPQKIIARRISRYLNAFGLIKLFYFDLSVFFAEE